MKKAIIDQILLGLFIFVALIVFGATVSDNMQARDKYYNLKKITDNAALTLGKYYAYVEQNETNAQEVYNQMLLQTKLGNEVKDTIQYSWHDLDTDLGYVVVTIPEYIEETFWFKLLGLASFTLKAQSVAVITTLDTPSPKSNYTYGVAPFAINDNNFTIGDTLDFTYALTSEWDYSLKDTFYPLITNCDCDCAFILSNKFDFTELGFDVDSCDPTSAGCTTHGESEFSEYAKLIDDIYYSKQSIDFELGETTSPLCLLGTYLGNDTSTWATQINHLSSGIYDLVGNDGESLPLEMDFVTLGPDGKANGTVRVLIDELPDIVVISNPTNQYITLKTTVIAAVYKEVHLEDSVPTTSTTYEEVQLEN